MSSRQAKRIPAPPAEGSMPHPYPEIIPPAQQVPPALPQTTDDKWLDTIRTMGPILGVEGIGRLMDMREREQDRERERLFSADMAAAQGALEPIRKNKRNDQTSSNYADIAALIKAASKTLAEHGIGFSCVATTRTEDHLGMLVEITHRSGYRKEYRFEVPWDGAGIKGNTNKTNTHAYGSTWSYGRRYAFSGIFNLATEDDDGNTAAGKPPPKVITDGQREALQFVVDADDKLDINKLLTHFRVSALADLPASRYAEFAGILKERKSPGANKL